MPVNRQCRKRVEASHHSETGENCESLCSPVPLRSSNMHVTAYLQILVGIQEMLSNPNNSDPAQEEAYQVLRRDKAAYAR